MSFGSKPESPDPIATSQTQQAFNTGAGTSQQELNMVDQSTPIGSLSYTQSGTNPDGTPKFAANTQLAAPFQSILDNYGKTASTLGSTASTLAGNTAGMYSSAPDLSNKAVVDQMMKWGQDYYQPRFDQQESNLAANLRNQGIAPGSEAWNNANNLQSRNENDAFTSLFMQAQPTAYNEAVQTYQLPMQTIQSLMGGSSPTTNIGAAATPTAQVQPANYQGTAEQNYTNQLNSYNNTQSGIWGLIGSGVKALGGTMLGGGPGGGGGGNASTIMYG